MSTASADVLRFPRTGLGETDRQRAVAVAALLRQEAVATVGSAWGSHMLALGVSAARPDPSGDYRRAALECAENIAARAGAASVRSNPANSRVLYRVFARMRAVATRPHRPVRSLR